MRLKTTSPIYRERVKRPKWSVRVSPLMDQYEGGRILRRRLPHYTKAQHEAAARDFMAQSKRMQSNWNKLIEREHRRVFGRAWEPLDYKISGIGREEYSESAKNKLRALAQRSGEARSAAEAHWRAAGRRKRLGNPHAARFKKPKLKRVFVEDDGHVFAKPDASGYLGRIKANPRRRRNPSDHGYYVWGRTTSVAWFKTRAEAEREAERMNYRGGQHYTVRPADPRHPLNRLRHHVTGAIERGEKRPIKEKRNPVKITKGGRPTPFRVYTRTRERPTWTLTVKAYSLAKAIGVAMKMKARGYGIRITGPRELAHLFK